MTKAWPKLDCWIERTFTATHSLEVSGGCAEPHQHDYIIKAGWSHEVAPSGLSGSKALCDWDRSVTDLLAGLDDLNAVCAPYPPTIEVLAIVLLGRLPGFFDWVELTAYNPSYTVRVDRRAARKLWK